MAKDSSASRTSESCMHSSNTSRVEIKCFRVSMGPVDDDHDGDDDDDV